MSVDGRRGHGTEMELERERLYKLIKDRILAGELKPGTALSENLLAQEFGVSRTPAREALARLALEKLVDPVPKRGTFVSPLPSISYVRQLYELREALAGMAARLAAKRSTPEMMARLQEIVDRMATTTDLGEKGTLADDFIAAIDAASGNVLLAEANRALLDQIHRLRHTVMSRDEAYFGSALKRREQLLDAIRSRDGQRAETIARQIVERVREDALRMLVEL